MLALIGAPAAGSPQRQSVERLDRELEELSTGAEERLDLMLQRARALMSWDVSAARGATLEAAVKARELDRRDYLALAMALEARLISMTEGAAPATEVMIRARDTMPPDADVEPRGYLAVIEVGHYYMIDEYGLAAESLELALELAKRSGSKRLMADCLLELHDLFYATSTAYEPAADLKQAEQLLEELDDERGLLRVRLRMASVWMEQGLEQEAEQALIRLSESAEAAGDRSLFLAASDARYSTALYRSEYAEAIAFAISGIEMSRLLGSDELLAWNLDNLAWAYLLDDRAEEAEPYLKEALAIAERLELRVLLTAVVDSAAELAIAREDGDAFLAHSLRRRALAEEGLGRETRDEALARSVLSELRSGRRAAHDEEDRRAAALDEARREYEGRIALFRWGGAALVIVLTSLSSILLFRGKRRAERLNRRIVEQTELARRVQEARDRLESELAELERLDGLGLLSAGFAHDFNNILCAITGNAELLLKPQSESDQGEMVDAILRSSRRATDLCKRLMDYARPSPANREVVDLNELVAGVRALLEAGKRGTTGLQVEFESRSVVAKVDRTAIEQVLINLATNAQDASVGAKTVVVRVLVHREFAGEGEGVWFGRPSPADAYAVLEVSDDGNGLKPDLLRRVFDPFFTTKFEGRGLGLSVAHGIVRAHGGAFHVVSEQGRGTTFAAYLPISGAPVSAEPEEASSSRAPRLTCAPGAAVLAVDDEAGVLSYVQNALTRSNHEVHLASSAPEAGRLLDKHGKGVGVMLLDLSMPEVDGDEFLRSIRQEHGDLPVVIMSGHDETFVRDRINDSAVAAILHKPFSVAELFEALDCALSVPRSMSSESSSLD